MRGTKAEDAIKVLMLIPEEERKKVKEVTMDLSESMRSIIEAVFPDATITLDCFHIMKRCLEAVEEFRLRYKREAQAEINREMRRYKKRGRKATRRNAPFRPPVLSNGDTLVELLTRSKHALTQTHDKWSERQQARMRLLFQMYPKLKELYDIVNKLRSIFRCKVFD